MTTGGELPPVVFVLEEPMSIPEAYVDLIEADEVHQLISRMRPYESRLKAAFDWMEKIRIAELSFTDSRMRNDHLTHHYDHSSIDPFWSFSFTLYGIRGYQAFIVPEYAVEGDSGCRTAVIEHSITFDDFFSRFDVWEEEKERIIRCANSRYHTAWRQGRV